EADKAATSTLKGTPKPIPIADERAGRGLPGTANKNKGGLLSQMQQEVIREEPAEDSRSARKNPHRRGASAERYDVQPAVAEEPAGEDEGSERVAVERTRDDDRYGRKPAEKAPERWNFDAPDGSSAPPDRAAAREPQERTEPDGQDLFKRNDLSADDREPRESACAEREPADQDNFAPITLPNDQGPDAFAPPPARSTAATEGTGRPGGAHLEGNQAPSLSIQKIAPAEIQVGKPATFTIKVRNVGTVVAQGVEVYDMIPQGTQLVSTTPKATRGPQGQLVFDLGAIKPNEEAMAQVQLTPMTEGEIGSVATVHFRADASARSVATKPLLTLKVTGPAQVMIGENVNFKIK